jgi:curved DNA-binding protein
MDYYKILGVDRNATPDEIKKAYRKMAAKHHPDRGGDTAEFQKIEEAYRNLSDPQLKSQHDNPDPFGGGGGFPGGFSFNFGGGNPFDDLFSQFMGGQRRQQQRVYTVSLWVTLEQVAKGTEEAVQFNTDRGIKTFSIKVPQGVEDGQQVRYQNLMPDGDLQIEFRVHRHQVFDRRGLDLYVTKEISVFDLILGTSITVSTILGETLEVTIPPKTKPGKTLRVHNRGLSANGRQGDQFILMSATIPDTISDELLSLLERERQNN